MAKFSAIHALGNKEALVRSQEGAPIRIELAEFGSLVQLFAKKGKEGAVMKKLGFETEAGKGMSCLLYTSPSPRDQRGSRMPSSA